MTQNYKSQILYMAINEYLDEIVSSLNAIEIKSLDRRIDRIVWELTTKIYTSSGYRVDLTWVRDTVCSRIEEIKQQQAFEQKRREEQDRIAAEQKRIAENARLLAAQQKARCDAELKEARRLEAEKKAHLTAEKERIAKEALRIEQQRKTAEIEQKVVEIKQQYRDERASLLELINGDEGKAIIFMLIRPFIAEKFSIHENEVKPERNLCTFTFNFNSMPSKDDLSLEACELIMTLEEEFDIEISCKEEESIDFPYCRIKDIVELLFKKPPIKSFINSVI